MTANSQGSKAAERNRMKGYQAIGLSCAGLLACLVLAVLPVVVQSNDGQKHTLAINGYVHLYRTDTAPADYPGDFIAVLAPKDEVKVMQAVYKQAGYMAVNIRLRDGREGWVFSGESIDLQ